MVSNSSISLWVAKSWVPPACPLKLGLSSVDDGGRRTRQNHSCTSPSRESHHFLDLLWRDIDALFMEGVQVSVLRWTPHWVLWRACKVSPLDTSLLQKAQFWLSSFQVLLLLQFSHLQAALLDEIPARPLRLLWEPLDFGRETHAFLPIPHGGAWTALPSSFLCSCYLSSHLPEV